MVRGYGPAAGAELAIRETPSVLPIFVYGTLRPGSWNHDRWLRPWLARPCRPATLAGYALHHVDGLPYVAVELGASVVGDVALLADARAVAALDELEDVAGGHYERNEVSLVDGARAWTYVAGRLVAGRLGPDTVVAHGDWLRVA